MEATRYTLLECNRLRAGINESTDEYKNTWRNNVNSSGIVVNKGDVISLESTSINTIGSTEETMEFTGEENENGYIDNKIQLGVSFYVNNSGRNLIPLPLYKQTTFLYYGISPNNQFLLNRGLGEPNFARPSFAGTDSTTKLEDETMKPYYGLASKVELSKVDGASLTGSGYIIGEEYIGRAVPDDPAQPLDVDSGFRVKILDVTTEGTNSGIPTNFVVTNMGNWYKSVPVRSAASLFVGYYDLDSHYRVRMRLLAPVDSSKPTPSNLQDLEVTLQKEEFFSKQASKPDGKRYYYQDGNYTGVQINHEQFNQFSPNFTKRIEQVKLEAQLGLSTPETLGTYLTEQLTEPTRLNTDFRKSQYLSGQNLEIEIGDDVNSTSVVPTIVETPTYKAMPCNSCNARKSTGGLLSGLYAGRRTFFDNVVYSNPDRIIGLQHTRQFYYDRSQNHADNMIHTGNEDGLNRGDFNGFNGYTGQTIGNIGLNQCCLMDFTQSNNIVTYNKGGWILTNVYFTEDNIKAIAAGYKRAELYYGTSTNEISNDALSQQQKQDLAVALDLGLYYDEKSNGRTVINPATYTNRRRFNTFLESNKGQRADYYSDVAYTNITCQGTIPNASFNYEENKQYSQNDGQQLSSIVVTSRWRDEFDYSKRVGTGFTDCYNKLTSQTGNYRFSISNQSESRTFMKNYTDTKYGYLSYDDLIGYSKKYDVACIPVYGEPGTEWDLFGGRPFIAYRSHLNLGEGTYDPEINGTDSNWQIDKFNCPYGIQMGYDTSFVRNEAAFVYNINFAITKENNNDLVKEAAGMKTYPEYVMSGAANPQINFNTDNNRFEITGFNTPMTIGNGQIQGSQQSLIPEDNPNNQCVELGKVGGITRVLIQPDPTFVFDPLNPASWADEAIQSTFANTRQSQSSIIDSYTGISIENITLSKNDGSTIELSYYGSGLITSGNLTPTDTWDNDILRNTILGKMGFSAIQLLPRNGTPSGIFNINQSFTKQNSYYDVLTNTPKPMTTGSFFSSPEYQATVTNSINLPLFSASGNTGLQARPLVNQGAITALQLPQKLEYPYLNVYSSIVANGTNTVYYGGGDGKSQIPCLGYITRYNNSGDFFYQIASNYNFTALKDFVLTDIDTDIRLPDGSRPRLEPHSSVIYKITSVDILPEIK